MSEGRPSPPADQAKVSVMVAVPPVVAFRLFTEEIDLWWRRGLRFRIAGKNRGIIHLEPRLGGRLFESVETRAGTKVFETGRITSWEPPARLAFDWRAVNFAPAEKTEVEVTFEPLAPPRLELHSRGSSGAPRSRWTGLLADERALVGRLDDVLPAPVRYNFSGFEISRPSVKPTA